MRISVSEPDFENLCAESSSEHKAEWFGSPPDETMSLNLAGCESLGDRNRIFNPVRH